MRRNAFNLTSIDNNLFPNFEKVMRTDVIDANNEYHLNIELPGYNKEDISVSYDDGYLTIHAKHEVKEEKKVHSEITYSQEASRSFYVGDIDESLIKAKYEDGILKLNVPKQVSEEKQNLISIE